MKKLAGFLFCIMLITSLAACSNTFNGAGRDMENMGRWVQKNV
jgi:predicted small secreted protein